MSKSHFSLKAARMAVLAALAASFLAPAASSAWEYRYGLEQYDPSTQFSRMAVDADGSVAIAGYHQNLETNRGTWWVRKVGSDGHEIWGNTTTAIGEPVFLQLFPNGDVFLTVQRLPRSDADVGDPTLMWQRLDSQTGAIKWSVVERSPGFGGVGVLPDGDVIVSQRAEDRTVLLRRLSGEDGREMWAQPSATGVVSQVVAADATTFWVSADRVDPGPYAAWVNEYDAATGNLRYSQWLDGVYLPGIGIDSAGDLVVVSAHGELNIPGRRIRKYQRGTHVLLQNLFVEGEFWTFAGQPNPTYGFSTYDNQESSSGFLVVDPVTGEVTPGMANSGFTVVKLAAVEGGNWVAFGLVYTEVAPWDVRPFVIGLNPAMTEILWQQALAAGNDLRDAQGPFFLNVAGDNVTAATLVAGRLMEDCPDENCYLKDVVVARFSARTGQHDALCGNGILEPGEHCDDGNGVESDACPSVFQDTCRYTSKLTRSGKGNPSKDIESCRVGWFATESKRVRDRRGFRKGPAKCVDNDPRCDFDPTPGVCSFRVAACLNNDDRRLPNCVPLGIESVNLVEVKVTPELTPGESPDPRTEVPPMVEDALTHLLDPSKPEDGHTVTLPVPAEKQDVCSDPAPVNVPLRLIEGKYKARRVRVTVESSTGGATPIVSESALKLVCIPAEN